MKVILDRKKSSLKTCTSSRDDINHFLSLPILADNPVKIKRSPNEPLPKELIGKDFSFKTVMLIGTIDCDIEGKISRRYMMDLRERKINRLNALTVNDLVNFNISQRSEEHTSELQSRN